MKSRPRRSRAKGYVGNPGACLIAPFWKERTMKRTALLWVLITALPVSAAPGEAPKADARADVAAIAAGNSAFTCDLYAKLAAKEGNLFFSPASIHAALAMTYAGAAGNTAEQMKNVLHFSLPGERLHPAFASLIGELNRAPEGRDKKPAYELFIANTLWGQRGYPFRADFLSLLKDSYGAGMNEVDFKTSEESREQARKAINDWAATQTRDKIKDLIPAGLLTELTRLVLTNAVYFKSNWAEQFSEGATRDDAFKLSADKSVNVPMMRLTKRFAYAETDDLQVLGMPYTMNCLSMFVLLPKKADGLAGLEKSLTAENLGKGLSYQRCRPPRGG